MDTATLPRKTRILTKIPLLLTVLRIVISPIFLFLYLSAPYLGISFTTISCVLIALLSVSELTDLLDGYYARKFNIVTDLGKILDPMADSISRISIFFLFTQGIVALPLYLVLVFFYRDAMISTLRTICGLKGYALAARKSGKIKAVIQAIAIFSILTLMLLFGCDVISLKALRLISFNIVLFSAVYTLFSGVEYFIANRSFCGC